MYLYNFLDSSKFSSLNYHGVSSLSGTMRMGYGGGVYQTAEVINGFQLLSSGTTGGTAKLYGLKQLCKLIFSLQLHFFYRCVSLTLV